MPITSPSFAMPPTVSGSSMTGLEEPTGLWLAARKGGCTAKASPALTSAHSSARHCSMMGVCVGCTGRAG